MITINTTLPDWWIETNAENFCFKVADGTHDSPKQNDEWKFLVTSKNLKNWRLDLSSSYKISYSDYELVNKRSKVDKWDILLWMIGTVGEVSLISEEPDFAIKNVWLFKCWDEITAKYLYYFLKSPLWQNYIFSRLSWTTQKYITLWDLRKFPIYHPKEKSEQQAIAKILSSFDDKIELLREQNKTLEKMAQTIFGEWFGKYSVDDELPEGWRVGKLSDFWNIICWKTPSKDNKDFFGWDIPFIKIPDMHNEVYISETVDTLTELWANTQKNKFIPENSICVSCIATVWLVWITTKFSQTNQQINSIIPFESFYLEYLYFSLTKIKNDLIAMWWGGSATLNINTTSFSNIEINIPDIEILKSFHEKVQNMFEKIKINNEEIQTLSKTRDELLPKLMKGEVRVV